MFVIQGLKNFLDKLFFAGVLLLGLQLPSFVTQYQQNIDAHYHESASQLQKYQVIADLFYGGDLTKLVLGHEDNAIAAIKAEAKLIRQLMQRNEYLQQELNALDNQPLLEQSVHLLKHLDADITHEVLDNYSMSVPLSLDAIVMGLVLAFVCSIAVHILLAVLVFLALPRSRDKAFYS